MTQRTTRRIVICEFMDETAVACLAEVYDTRYDEGLVDRPAELRSAIATAAALIVRNRTQVDAALVAAAPALEVVGRLGVGLDNIDLPACAARGIDVVPATGANAVSVAEYVICVAMMLLRGAAYTSSSAVAGGSWPRAALSRGSEMSGKTLGVVGFGTIGRITGRLGRAMGMQVIASDAQIADDAAVWAEEQTQPHSLDALLARADIVSLHVPLTPATKHLIDAARIAQMKRGAILVNSARGGVVDEAALAAALRSGQLGGAAIDVFEREPLAAGSAFADCPNLLLTPHIAGVTIESNLRVSMRVAEGVDMALRARGSR